MPTIIRRSFPTTMETRKEIFVATSWQVHSSIWTPPTDVYETEENLIVKVEVAGMREDDFEVSVEDQVLIIRDAGAEYKDGFLTIVFPKIHVKHIEVE